MSWRGWQWRRVAANRAVSSEETEYEHRSAKSKGSDWQRTAGAAPVGLCLALGRKVLAAQRRRAPSAIARPAILPAGRLHFRIHDWLDVRPGEGRRLWLACLGAFLLLAALTLGRALREALYLGAFPVNSLPVITAAYAALSLPAVLIFARLLAAQPPRRVVSGTVLVLGAGLALLWLFALRGVAWRALVVALYLWTAVGILLISSGFWVVAAELFPLRGAKRLFGLISAGGTAGAMATGLALGPLTARLPLIALLPVLVALHLALWLLLRLLPGEAAARPVEPTPRGSARESLALVWTNGHLRGLAFMIAAAAAASTLVDFQFKEAARARFADEQALTAYFGALYGWSGAAALVFQLLVASRLMSRAGIGAALAVLPLVLLLGSGAFALLPGLLLITVLRGADGSLRKSLLRPLLEFLYVPLAAGLRRRTKTFVDSVVDPCAEGLAAGLIALLVTGLGLPSRWLSLAVAALAAALLVMSRRMQRQYLDTLATRLGESGDGEARVAADLEDRRLLSGTFSRLDLSTLREGAPAAAQAPAAPGQGPPRTRAARLRSQRTSELLTALRSDEPWDEIAIGAAIGLLARDDLVKEVIPVLEDLGERALPQLIRVLTDEGQDLVVRRRIPRLLVRRGGESANAALLAVLRSPGFELRYRAALALAQREQLGRFQRDAASQARVWAAIHAELLRGRPALELQQLLDAEELSETARVQSRLGERRELSLEHLFRLLEFVLEPAPVRAAAAALLREDAQAASLALEYLAQVLPPGVRERLWAYIGDLSERERRRGARPIERVVQDLLDSRATLFGGELDRAALQRLIEERDAKSEGGA
jgi:hypothetical protein